MGKKQREVNYLGAISDKCKRTMSTPNITGTKQDLSLQCDVSRMLRLCYEKLEIGDYVFQNTSHWIKPGSDSQFSFRTSIYFLSNTYWILHSKDIEIVLD